MKNLILILLVFLASCGAKETVKETVVSAEVKAVAVPEAKLEFSDPVFIKGSDFGSYFQILHKQGDFETMLKFTSSDCIKKNGVDKLLKTYEDMKFDYKIKLKSKKENSDSTITLNYERPGIMTEKGMFRIVVRVQNDTVKFVSSNVFLK